MTSIASMIKGKSIQDGLIGSPDWPRWVKGSSSPNRKIGTLSACRRNHADLIEADRWRIVRRRAVSSPYLNCGTTGMVMRGGGSGAILDALPIPLGSTVTLFRPPMFAGPGGMPLIGILPDPTAPAVRAACANEAAGVARDSNNAKAIFAAVLDMTKLRAFA
jgi:hypothetical protein